MNIILVIQVQNLETSIRDENSEFIVILLDYAKWQFFKFKISIGFGLINHVTPHQIKNGRITFVSLRFCGQRWSSTIALFLHVAIRLLLYCRTRTGNHPISVEYSQSSRWTDNYIHFISAILRNRHHNHILTWYIILAYHMLHMICSICTK